MNSALSLFGTNLLGTIAGQQTLAQNVNYDFIPINSSGGTIQIKGDTASWLGLQSPLMQKYAYEYCYPVSSIIDRLAEYDLNGVVEILRAKGKGANDYATGTWATDMNQLFSQPNEAQGWENFRGQQLVYKRVFGYCPVLPIAIDSMPGVYMRMVNLPPWLFGVNLENSEFPYYCDILGKRVDLRKDQLIILSDSFLQDEAKNFLLPRSRMIGLDMAVSNICAAMEADNVLLKKKGPLGFISQEPTKDASGFLPLKPGDKKDLQNSLNRYGLSWSQYQYVISNFAAKWNPMSYDVKQLGTKETVVAGEKAICHRFNFPYILYEMSDSAYSANGTNAEKNAYTSNIIPNSLKDFSLYNKFFKSKDNNAVIKCDFSSVPCLQADKRSEAEARKAMNDAYQVEYDNDLITKNQWRTAMGYDTVEGGDVYKSESLGVSDDGSVDPTQTPIDIEAQAKANLKGSVGGVQGLIQIQTSVSQGITDYNAAVTMLYEIYGFEENIAKQLLGNPKKQKQDQPL